MNVGQRGDGAPAVNHDWFKVCCLKGKPFHCSDT